MQQRYQCAQEASRQESSGSSNYYGGSSQSRPVISLSLFTACMGTHRWHQSPDGYGPPDSEKTLMED